MHIVIRLEEIKLENTNSVIQLVNSWESIPHSILIIGEVGSGKHDLVEYISNRYNMKLITFDKPLTREQIVEFRQILTPEIIEIDIDQQPIKIQNDLLKLFEEPNEFVYIILKTTDKHLVLNTLKTRAYCLTMPKKSIQELEPFIINDKELTLALCTTPGQVDIANKTNLTALYGLCTAIISNIGTSNAYDTMSISHKINFSDEYDKYDLDLFCKMLAYVITQNCQSDLNLKLYSVLVEFEERQRLVNNKQWLFENMMLKMWCVARGLKYAD